MRKVQVTVAIAFIAVALGSLTSFATAGDTLTRIKTRGEMRCGVSNGILGFSMNEPDGRWSGMDVDFCRAVAAAVLSDAGKVKFFPLAASERFRSLKAGEIDLLVRNTTWTLEREATLEVMFAGILYFDAQGFLVSTKSEVRELSQLSGSTVCAVKGSTHATNLAEYFHDRSWSYQPVIVESQGQAAEALFSGRCQAFTSERPQLMAMRLKAPGGPTEFVLLPDQISKEPMGPVVRRGDDEWFTIIRWVLFALLRAEELGITQSDVRSRLEAQADPAAQRWAVTDELVCKGLGIPPGWATRAVESAGNYGEMFERNLGSQSALKLERGLNRLWTEGGLMYAPPFH